MSIDLASESFGKNVANFNRWHLAAKRERTSADVLCNTAEITHANLTRIIGPASERTVGRW
jgi:hypothetical protein